MPRVASCPDVRRAVLESASNFMELYGYKKMTIDDIAKDIGIGKATLYGYFENKQAIALAVIDGYHAEIQSKWNLIADEGQCSADKLRKMIQERVMYLFEVAKRHRLSMDECLGSLRPLVLCKRDHYNQVESQILSRVLSSGVNAGEFEIRDVQETARAILTCTSGLMPLNFSPRELASQDEVQFKTKLVTDLILRGIGPHKTVLNRRNHQGARFAPRSARKDSESDGRHRKQRVS